MDKINSNIRTIGDLRRAMRGVPDQVDVHTYGGGWDVYTLVRDIITDARSPESDRFAAVVFRKPYEAEPGPRWKQLPPSTGGHLPPMTSAMVPSLVREQGLARPVPRSPVQPPVQASQFMTVGDLRRAIEDVADDIELYVYGGEMNTYSLVWEIVTDMWDVDHDRPAAVLFWGRYQPKSGEGWKQLPPGTRGYVKGFNYQNLPWYIRVLMKLTDLVFG